MENVFKINVKQNTFPSTSHKRNKKTLKYDSKYIKLDFIVSSSCVNNEKRLMCVICLNTLSNNFMRPGKLNKKCNYHASLISK